MVRHTNRALGLSLALAVIAGGVQAGTPADRYSIDGATDTVLDRRTGLVWQRTTSSTTWTWSDARSACANLGQGFRLPTVKELLSLTDPVVASPSIDTVVFPGTEGYPFWSASPYVAGPAGRAWVVDFSDGSSRYSATEAPARVRCVR